MRLRYTKKDGTHMEFELGDKPITIGRSPEADIILLDERVSRIHCGVRLWDGDFFLKDLKSRNGTFVNGQAVEVTKLEAGDTIRVGSTVFVFEQDSAAAGAETALKEISEEMDLGKGYSTILREIVDDVGERPPPPRIEVDTSRGSSAHAASSVTAPQAPVGMTPTTEQKPVRVIIKKRTPGEASKAPGFKPTSP